MKLKPAAKNLHLGCGPTAKTAAGWLNLDASWNARLAKHPFLRQVLTAVRLMPPGFQNYPWAADIFIHDIRKPLPFEADSFAGIYAAHLLEHLYLDAARALLKECYRVLEPRGVLRIVVPDLGAIIRDYVNATANQRGAAAPQHPADQLNQYFFIQYPTHNFLYELYARFTDFHSHKWMYDADSLRGYLTWAGFVEVQEMRVLESRLPDLGQVEDPATSGLVMEGLKPGG